MRNPIPSLSLLALSLVFLNSACKDAEPKPSVLLITLDTTRADYLGCYGAEEATPAIDSLAARGNAF